MVELNLSTAIMLHIAANIKPGLSDVEFLEKEIALWLTSDGHTTTAYKK